MAVLYLTQEMVEFGVAVLVMCYDGASYWRSRERLAEMAAGIVTFEHSASEMPGLMSLRDHLAMRFPAVEFSGSPSIPTRGL